ncbi:t-SNARE domain-containing protein 1 [Branchiostoma belcheri]|nr:t-SNARE domain-containing protein 1 [Branchiostoma belcheri]
MSRGEFGAYGSVETGGFDRRDERYGVPRGAGYQDNGSNDVNRLCELTSTNIFTISNNASSLEKTLKQIGSANDSHQLRDRVHNMQQQTNLLVSETARCLKQLSQMTRGAPKPQKLQVDRLSNEFKQSVQRYGIIQKRVAEQSRMSVDSIRSPSRASQQGFLDDDYGDESTSLLEEEQQRRRVEELQRQEQVIDFEGDIIREREERIREIEADILDINEIFRDLGTMQYLDWCISAFDMQLCRHRNCAHLGKVDECEKVSPVMESLTLRSSTCRPCVSGIPPLTASPDVMATVIKAETNSGSPNNGAGTPSASHTFGLTYILPAGSFQLPRWRQIVPSGSPFSYPPFRV